MSTNNVDATLAERGNRYGHFSEHARITQNLKLAMTESRNWASLSSDKKECLEMIAHKISRILNGDPEYIDSWHDIIGYTRLVEKNLEAAEATSLEVEMPLTAGQTVDAAIRELHGMAVQIEHFCDVTGSMQPGYSVECRHCATSSRKGT